MLFPPFERSSTSSLFLYLTSVSELGTCTVDFGVHFGMVDYTD